MKSRVSLLSLACWVLVSSGGCSQSEESVAPSLRGLDPNSGISLAKVEGQLFVGMTRKEFNRCVLSYTIPYYSAWRWKYPFWDGVLVITSGDFDENGRLTRWWSAYDIESTAASCPIGQEREEMKGGEERRDREQ